MPTLVGLLSVTLAAACSRRSRASHLTSDPSAAPNRERARNLRAFSFLWNVQMKCAALAPLLHLHRCSVESPLLLWFLCSAAGSKVRSLRWISDFLSSTHGHDSLLSRIVQPLIFYHDSPCCTLGQSESKMGIEPTIFLLMATTLCRPFVFIHVREMCHGQFFFPFLGEAIIFFWFKEIRSHMF